jgi:hypothetical protein
MSAVALLISTLLALRIGIPDLLVPVSVSSQLTGLAFALAGAAGLAGLAGWREIGKPLLGPARPAGRARAARPGSTGQIACAFGGAVAAVYVDATIAFYAHEYKTTRTIEFGALALICLFLAGMLLPLVRSVWKDISGALKGLGALATALGLLAQFWYVSIYIPRNTQVGINYSLTLGPVARSGDNTLATLQLTMADESSLTAVVLGSMVVVSGISYQPASAGTHPTVQHRMTAYARSGGNPDIGFSGRETPVVLAVDSPIDNNALLLPGTVYTKDLVVVVPGSGIAALQVAIMVDYARQTRLVLGHAAWLKHPVRVPGCPAKYTVTWASPIQESALRSFATGPHHLYSSRCARLGSPFIAQTIGASVQPEPAGVERALRAHYGPFHNARYETFVLESPAAAAPASRP